jgi:hypothetical protein
LDKTVTDYRTCFSSDAGKRVLGDILINGGYFDTDLVTEGDIAVQNFVKKIVRKLGIFEAEVDKNGMPRRIKGIDSYINGLFGVEHG